MFTGIVECTGQVTQVDLFGKNKSIWINSPISAALQPDQSVSHSGVCLTVEEVRDQAHRVTAIDETLKRTHLGDWRPGSIVNLERSLKLGDRIDGHFVQGHVDGVGECKRIRSIEGSYEVQVLYPNEFAPLLIEKGSVCINGISLTLFKIRKKSFRVAIIPYTFENTNARTWAEGEILNLEFDMVGKYLHRFATLKNQNPD